jgi:hypothetical protein
MAALFSGARKYRLGLTVAHQDLYQLRSTVPEVERAVLGNAYTRICFRLGDEDAKTLAQGFSFFEADDLGNLGTGEAICRVGRKEHDFNLRTIPMERVDAEALTSRRREIRERRIHLALGERDAPKRAKRDRPRIRYVGSGGSTSANGGLRSSAPPTTPQQAEARLGRRIRRLGITAGGSTEPRRPGKGGPEHTYLQELIKRYAGGTWLPGGGREQVPGGREPRYCPVSGATSPLPGDHGHDAL